MTNPDLQNAAAIATVVATVATVVYVLATLAMLIVLIRTAEYAKGQLESAEKSRQLSSLRDLSDKWSSALLREARELIEQETGGTKPLKWTRPSNAPDLSALFKIFALANFFEDMGILEKEGQLPLAQVRDRFETSILHYRKILDGLIIEQQKEDPSVLSNFTSLAAKLSVKS